MEPENPLHRHLDRQHLGASKFLRFERLFYFICPLYPVYKILLEKLCKLVFKSWKMRQEQQIQHIFQSDTVDDTHRNL